MEKRGLNTNSKRNLNANIWELEYKSQKVVRELGIKIGVLSGKSKKEVFIIVIQNIIHILQQHFLKENGPYQNMKRNYRHYLINIK